jgi:AraC-like DNA-binding protein
MSDLTIAASGVRALMELAVSKGADRCSLAERSRIDPADLKDRDNRIPFAKYVALMKAAQKMCNDPALALHFGEAVDGAEISISHHIGAPSIAEAMAIVNRYAALTVEVDQGSSDRYVFSRSGGQLWLIDTRRNANDFPELTESSFARMICTMRPFLGDKQLLKAVHVTHAAPSYRAEYDRIFRVPVVFESDKNALLMDDALLRFKPPLQRTYVSEVLTARAEELLEKLESSKSMRGRVERLLMPSLKDGDVSMDAIASELGLSRQTLFRKLKAEGVTFEKVLDELRHKMALHYLSGKKSSVSQTAHLVGFSDPASFSRAFKRWTGSSPRGFTESSRERDTPARAQEAQ